MTTDQIIMTVLAGMFLLYVLVFFTMRIFGRDLQVNELMAGILAIGAACLVAMFLAAIFYVVQVNNGTLKREYKLEKGVIYG